MSGQGEECVWTGGAVLHTGQGKCSTYHIHWLLLIHMYTERPLCLAVAQCDTQQPVASDHRVLLTDACCCGAPPRPPPPPQA